MEIVATSKAIPLQLIHGPDYHQIHVSLTKYRGFNCRGD
jgi:hypothetical protein